MPKKAKEKRQKDKRLYRVIICALIALMGITTFIPINVHAAVNDTTTITNYGVFDWVAHTDFIDGNTSSDPRVITNSGGRSVKFSVLGHQESPRGITVSELLGSGVIMRPQGGTEHEFIVQDFQKNTGGLYVDEVVIGAYAEYNDGSFAPVTIYKNGFYSENAQAGNNGYWCTTTGTPCTQNDVMYRGTPTSSKPLITLKNLDRSYDGFMLRWDNPGNIRKYVFTFFQITKYRTFDLVGWTTDLNDNLSGYGPEAKVDPSIKKTASYTTTAGTFNPNFSMINQTDKNPKWVNSINSSFNAGVQGLFHYPEISLASSNYSDFGRNGTDTRDSRDPSGASTGGSDYEQLMASANGGYDLVNARWTCNGNHCDAEAYNANRNMKKTASFDARYWNTTNSGQDRNWQSGDSSWCGHVNAGGTPCYKNSGHAHNTVWDGTIINWEVVSGDQQYVIDSTYYYQKYSNLQGTATVGPLTKVGNEYSNVTNKNGQITSNPVKGDDIASVINVYDEGVFKLFAKVNGSLNKQITVESEKFYIDKTSPNIVFDKGESEKWYTTIDLPKVTAKVTDNLSGINKLDVMRYKSKDGINWISDGTREVVYNFGENDKNVRFDAVTSKDIGVDLKATNGYMYYKVKATATDIAGNRYDTVSPIYKYDAHPTISYTLNPVRFYDQQKGKLNWTNQNVEVNFTVGDSESGLKELQITRGKAFNGDVVARVKTWSNPQYNEDGFLVGADFADKVKYLQTSRVLESDGLYVHAVDKNGHVTTIPYIVDHIDRKAPTISWGAVDGSTWNDGTLQDITAKLKDDLSGVDLGDVRRYKSVNGKTWELMPTENNQVVWEGNVVSKTFNNPNRDDLNVDLTIHMKAESGYLFYKAEVDTTDVAGNKATYTSPIIKFDRKPNISYTLNPPRLKGDNTLNWTNKDVKVDITLSDDEVGVQAVCLAKGTTWDSCINVIKTWRDDNYHEDLNVGASFVEDTRILKQDGLHLVVRDKIGNTNSTPYIVDHIDKVPPTANFTPDGYGPGKGPIDVTITVDDVPMKPDGAKSEVKEWEYCVSIDSGVTWDCQSGLKNPSAKVTITETGYNVIKVTVTDNAGNTHTTQSGQYIIVGNPPTLIAKTDYWWVNETDDIKEILANAEAISETDGIISDQIVITRITYQDGDIVDYPLTFRTDTPQNFVAEFEVTDSNGFTTKASQVYQVLEKSNVKPETGGNNDNAFNNIEVYQRYVDNFKIAIKDNSFWNMKEEYRAALDAALNNSDIKDVEIVTRSQH